MRLICGILMLDGSHASAEMLTQMCEAMQPDLRRGRCEVWQDGPVGLGVLGFGSDETGGLQQGPGSSVAADVRLDEPDELAAGGLDPEIALATLDRLGANAPLAMLGDFALAYWQHGAQELLLARDAMGVRPLFYYSSPGKFMVFASLPAAIHRSSLMPRELNEIALVHQMITRPQGDETLSRGMLALPAGHCLRASRSALTLERYWRPEVGRTRHRTPQAAAEELRSLMERVVRSRVRGSAPVAAHLSGGLDSSAIAVLAARELKAQGRTLLGYSFLPGPNGLSGQQGERPFVEAVLQQEPEILWKAVPPPRMGGSGHGAMQADWVLPLAESDPENMVCGDAARAGAELVLSGWGGDEGITYNGRGALADAFLRGRWGYLAAEIGALKEKRGFSARGVLYGDVLTPILPGRWLDLLERARGKRRGEQLSLLDLLTPELRRRVDAEIKPGVMTGPNVKNNQLQLLRSAHLALRTTNWALIGVRYGMAFTFPLLDRRVVEFALSLPTTWHLRDGWKRRVFRDAMDGVLPPLIQWRHDKLTPYPDSMYEMAANKEAVLEQLDEVARHPSVRRIFNMDKVRSLASTLPEARTLEAATRQNVSLPFLLVASVLQYARYVEEHF